jgi:fumarate reductase flavoprotein subunit
VKNRVLRLILGTVLLILGACPTGDSSGGGPDPFPGNPSGTDTGFHWGYEGNVYVTITMVNGYITEVDIEGEHESQNFGQNAIERAPAIIIAKNSVDIDTLSGATATSNAIKQAGQKAIDKILAAAQ